MSFNHGSHYDTIGKGYNSTRQADPYLTGRLLYFLGDGQGKRFLDIGCGTGNYTIALAGSGLDFTGVEPADKMLAVAQRRNPQINWLKGTAANIPANDNTFDGAIATLTIHHWPNLAQSMNEIHRVITPGGKIVFFTATPRQMEGYWLNYYFRQMLQSAIIQMPAFELMENALTNAGFKLTNTEKYFVKNDLRDHFLYSGKCRPEIYFDENIRSGISSFAALANENDVRQGLQKLRSDLESGEFETIRQKFENEQGDYLFIVAEKERW
jgi:ubiquinone/menaquinone biosynthesis C-methylase UbiE